jgi:hypothetical protein
MSRMAERLGSLLRWSSLARLRSRPGFLLFVAVASLYFASMSREIAWGDARPVYEVAMSMVHGQGVSVPTRWPSDAPPGRFGKFYAAQPWLPSLVHLPGTTIRVWLSYLKVTPEVSHLFDVLAVHLAGGLLGGLAAWLFFRLCRRHGASLPVARLASLVLALGSILWVYARYPFSEIVQIVCFTGFFLELTDLLRRLDRRTALRFGLWTGLLLNTKYIYALSLPGAVLLLAAVHRKHLHDLVRPALAMAAGLVPGAAMILLYNYLRYGSITSTGYTGVSNAMVENVLVSTWGFLFSPGKSIFLYTPPLLLALLGLPRFWRAHRATVLALLVTVVPIMYFYARFAFWPGDWSWGPRYMVFAVPVLFLPAIGFLSNMRWPGRSFAVTILALGLFVQVLGNAFYWDHYLRIALDVRTKWLGQPNRTASLTSDKGGFCEGCFEDVYPTVWLGPFQPMLGHLWLLRHVPFEHGWQRAFEDAPWRRHTRLALDGKSTYDRVRMDHWLYDTHQHRVAGWALLILLLSTSAVAGAMFVRSTRDSSE